MDITKLNLYQKLVEIRKQALYVQKESKGFNFNYASGESIICLIRPIMDDLGVLLVPDMEVFDFIEIKKGANLVSVPKITISYTWINGENPDERLKTRATFFEDKMAGCQSIGAMMTYAERYFLYKFFQVATGADDIETTYRDNGWSNKIEEPKTVQKVSKEPILVDVVGRGMTGAHADCPIHQQHIDDFVTHCRVQFGPIGVKEDIEGFVKRYADFCKGKLGAFEEKTDFWKKDPETLKADYIRSISKFKKPQAPSATTIA
jgi:hypothetical protein